MWLTCFRQQKIDLNTLDIIKWNNKTKSKEKGWVRAHPFQKITPF